MTYERRNVVESNEEDQVEQSFSDALDLIAAENANSCAVPPYCLDTPVQSNPRLSYLDKKDNESLAVDAKPDCPDPALDISVPNNQSNSMQIASKIDEEELEATQQSAIQCSGISHNLIIMMHNFILPMIAIFIM